MAKDLTTLFSPASVAVIGASQSSEKVGAIVLNNIISSGFKGAVYPVNPKYKQINGLKCFKDLNTLPEVPDLAVIAIPALPAVGELAQAGENGIKNAVVFSSGFKEIGKEGKKLEDRLINIAQKYNINILGPNCLGFVNNLCPINVTFGQAQNLMGNLRFISQSGAIASSLFDWCKTNKIGFSEFVTLGNKAVIDENDVLEYYDLKHSSPIGLYLESISKGRKFLQITGNICQSNPVFILKPGKTAAAAKAMQSHTGAIAGEDIILEAVINEVGAIRCQTLQEFFDLSRSFAWNKSPNGPKVAIISNAGGPAVISADAVTNEGLTLAEFDNKTHEKLLEILPRFSSLLNPVDVLGDALADRYTKASEVILQNIEVDALLVILTPQIMTQIKQTAIALGSLSKKYNKLIFCSFIGGSLVAEGEQLLNELKIPSFRYPEQAISALGKMWRFKKHQAKLLNINQNNIHPISTQNQYCQIIRKAFENGQKTLDNLEANQLIALTGIPTPPTGIISNLTEAIDHAEKFGYPVVLKLSSPNLLHKKAAGGVITGIDDAKKLENALNKFGERITHLDKKIQSNTKIQIQKEISSGTEVIIGIKHDPSFGPVLLFGAGGSLAEVIGDRNLHTLPINLTQVKQLVCRSKIYSLLSSSYANLDKLYKAIISLAQLVDDYPQISEIEINPAIVTQDNIWAVDCKVII